jgi:hypothetical protein
MSKKEPEHIEELIKTADKAGCVAYSTMFVLALVLFVIMFLIDKCQ